MSNAGVTIPTDPYVQSLNQTITLVKDFIVIGKYVRKKSNPAYKDASISLAVTTGFGC
jgi:hypothetical protein